MIEAEINMQRFHSPHNVKTGLRSTFAVETTCGTENVQNTMPWDRKKTEGADGERRKGCFMSNYTAMQLYYGGHECIVRRSACTLQAARVPADSCRGYLPWSGCRVADRLCTVQRNEHWFCCCRSLLPPFAAAICCCCRLDLLLLPFKLRQPG